MIEILLLSFKSKHFFNACLIKKLTCVLQIQCDYILFLWSLTTTTTTQSVLIPLNPVWVCAVTLLKTYKSRGTPKKKDRCMVAISSFQFYLNQNWIKRKYINRLGCANSFWICVTLTLIKSVPSRFVLGWMQHLFLSLNWHHLPFFPNMALSLLYSLRFIIKRMVPYNNVLSFIETFCGQICSSEEKLFYYQNVAKFRISKRAVQHTAGKSTLTNPL